MVSDTEKLKQLEEENAKLKDKLDRVLVLVEEALGSEGES